MNGTAWMRIAVTVLVLMVLAFSAAAQEAEAIPTASAMARVTKKVTPEYPAAAKQLNVQGSQEVQIVVSASGDVEDAKVLKGNALFTMATLSAVRQWKFSPLLKDGQPVRFSSTIVINYTK